MTTEKVKQFVLADLGLGDTNDERRVFEVAARWAFCAASFLSELQNNPNLQKEEIKTARALAEQVFGIDWEEDFEDCSLEQLQKKAKRLWKKSGFEPFLENAINVLIESAAPRCIKTALTLSRQCLEELKDDVKLRSSAISKDEEKLREEIVALEEDLTHLENCRQRIKEVDQIRNQLERNLDQILNALKEKAKVSLKDFFAEEDYKQSSSLKKLEIDVQKSLSDSLKNFDFFPKWISKTIQSAIEFKPSGIVKFDSEDKAENFANKAVAYAQERADNLLASVRQLIIEQVNQARSDLINSLEKETDPIIKIARTRLNQSFEIDLSLPPPTLDTSDDIFVNKPRIRKNTKLIDQGYENVRTKRKDIFSLFGLLPIYVTKKQKRPDKKEYHYTVSLNELIPEFNQSIEASIKDIEVRMSQYLDDDFRDRIEIFFEGLDIYLSNYRDSLKQAQEDQQLDWEEKKRLVNGLDDIAPKANEKIKKANSYLEYVNSMLQGQSDK